MLNYEYTTTKVLIGLFFIKFDIPFVYKTEWTPSANKNLMLMVVASSSKDGDQYKGQSATG